LRIQGFKEHIIKKIYFRWIFIVLITSNSAITLASELIYQPINPSFGGNALNGQILLSKAKAQNKYKDPSLEKGRDSLNSFEEQLNRQVLSLLSRRILDEAFGEEGLSDGGIFQSGDFLIEIITTDPAVITVSITNTVTRETTSIEIPVISGGGY